MIVRSVPVPTGLIVEELILEEMAPLLHAADVKDPAWLNNVINRSAFAMVSLSTNEMYVFGAYHGLTFHRPWSTGVGNLGMCAVMQLLLNPLQHHVKQLIAADNRTALVPAAEYYMGEDCNYMPTSMLGEIITHVGKLTGSVLEAYHTLQYRYRALTNYGGALFWNDLYKVPKKYQTDPIGYIIRNRSPHLFEDYLIRVYQGNLTRNDVYQIMGMIIPPTVDDSNLARYIQDNVGYYINVMKRQGNPTLVMPLDKWSSVKASDRLVMLEACTDLVILSTAQAYLPYSGRDVLLRKIVSLVDTPGFFLPLGITGASNQETVMATPVKDLPLNYSVAIAYGTLQRYWIYELEDLIHGFAVVLDGADAPRRPESKDPQYFTVEDLTQLLDIMTVMSKSAELAELQELTVKHRLRVLSALHPKDLFMKNISEAEHSSVLQMVELLEYFIITGMYMRRWQGPGHPYPLLDFPQGVPEQTVIVSDRLLYLREQVNRPEIHKIFSSMSLCDMDYVSGEIKIKAHTTLSSRFNELVSNNHCIKLGSTDFIFTAIYYLRILGRGDVVTFTLTDLTTRG